MDQVAQVNPSPKTLVATQPNHQSIGKNGSFWLPPKSSSTFASNLSHHSTKHKNQSVTPAKSGNHVVKTDITKAKPTANDLRSTIKPTPSFVTAKTGAVLSSAKQSPLVSSSLAKQSPSINQPIVHRGSPSFLDRVATQLPSKEPKILKESAGNKLAKDLFSNSQDTEAKDEQKKKRGGGAKNALNKTSMNSVETISNSSVSIDPKVVLNPNHSKQELKRFFQDSISPRIAYVSKFDKKIIRFALDLPDGGKLGVRLQKQGKALSLSLICPDSNSKAQISFLNKESFPESENLKIAIYSSYQEMDNFNSLAA